MKNIWLGFLIVLSIALQSFVAVANSDNNHQLDAQHLQTEHSHEVDNQARLNATSDTEHNVKDCHHCGHCQGSHSQWFLTKKLTSTVTKLLIPNQYFYLIDININFIEQLIRPPIA
ncbi:DUF2946 domain-containing protein [Colwellia sp. BRX8-4]|uniref:DUF2946 domain-containing protein n=1 Tax=Colwellia sp. BRX8-4 TaxID=2759836 RepID=UPI0015F4F8B9|nr:DUF2946 domain-containing protein [Colwellia sp. BRX8-4]MBA6372926.1 DUF2946 domain-containing protein [Colwellia sp. BRX8-4]